MRRRLVDLAAVLAGVAASWVVTDLIVAADERRTPLLLRPSRVREDFQTNERIQGAFHLGMAVYDAFHLGYHLQRTPRRPAYHGLQALMAVVRLGYHTVWSYRRHYRCYETGYERARRTRRT